MNVSIANPEITVDETEAVNKVLESGALSAGSEVRKFEEKFSEFCGTEHGIATVNGTAALHAALEVLDIEPGSLVLTTPFSFVATANAIRFAGARPVFADVDSRTFNLDPFEAEKTIRRLDGAVDAIVVVHLYGLPAEMDHFRDIADEYDLALIEDAAQAHGATYRGEPVGSIGDVGCFSFYPTKNMTTGEGGMITTNRDDLAERASRFIDHGRGDGPYDHPTLGHNYRMTDIAAAIGREQLRKLPEFIEARRENAAILDEWLAPNQVLTPVERATHRHSYHQYTIRTSRRDVVRQNLADRGIQTGVYYPNCIHELGCYEQFDTSTPVAEQLTDEVLSLPVHPNVSREELHTITDTVLESIAAEV